MCCISGMMMYRKDKNQIFASKLRRKQLLWGISDDSGEIIVRKSTFDSDVLIVVTGDSYHCSLEDSLQMASQNGSNELIYDGISNTNDKLTASQKN